MAEETPVRQRPSERLARLEARLAELEEEQGVLSELVLAREDEREPEPEATQIAEREPDPTDPSPDEDEEAAAEPTAAPTPARKPGILW